jgi:hypothetical protein
LLYRSRHKEKTCRLCGKIESGNWNQHWDRNHPDKAKKELGEDEEPVEAWCENWRDIRAAKKNGKDVPDPIN